MSFNVNKKGAREETVRTKARRSLVEKAIFEKSRSRLLNEILIESIVGKKFPGYIKGSEYQVVSLGDPIEDTVVKIIKYPRYPAVQGNTFKLRSTINKWGREHPLVKGIIDAAETGVTAVTDKKPATTAKADITGEEDQDILSTVSLEDELPTGMTADLVTRGISAAGDAAATGLGLAGDAVASGVDAIAKGVGTISDLKGRDIIPDDLSASPTGEPEDLSFLSDAPRIISYDRNAYRDLKGLQITLPAGPYDEIERIAKKEAGQISMGTESRPQGVYAIKSILDQIPTEMVGDIQEPSDPKTKGFDKKTADAVESFQRYVKIGVDGVVGPITARALLGKDNWQPALSTPEVRKQVLDTMSNILGEPVDVIRIDSYQSVSQTDLISRLRRAGLKNGNIIAGIMGNIASESSQAYNAVGDDMASAVSRGRIKIKDDPREMSPSDRDYLMKGIPVVAPKRPASLYRSFGLIQWNVSGGEGEGFLRRRLSGNPTNQNKLDTLTSLDNQVKEIVFLAKREFGKEEISKNAVKDVGEVEDYAYKWGNQVEKFRGHHDRQGAGKESYDHRIGSALEIADSKESDLYKSDFG